MDATRWFIFGSAQPDERFGDPGRRNRVTANPDPAMLCWSTVDGR